jgi:hypothetical protein
LLRCSGVRSQSQRIITLAAPSDSPVDGPIDAQGIRP